MTHASPEKGMKILRGTVAVIFATCLLLLSPGASAQSQSEAVRPVAKLNVLVVDSKNRAVADLRQEDFQVFEGDAPQTIFFFSKEDMPVSYGLLIDSSGSLHSQFKSVLDAGRIIISGNQPGDETFLVRFISSDKISLEQSLTPNKALLLDRLMLFQIEGGRTAVIDALFVSASHLRDNVPGADSTRRRRALILVSDGEDRDSFTKKDELVKLLREENIQVFSIGLIKDLDSQGGLLRKSPRAKAIKLLEDLAQETGGRAFLISSSSELPSLANELPRLLHTQYVVGYNPTEPPKKDSPRNVQVRLVDAPGRDKLKVIVRPGDTAKQSPAKVKSSGH
jgi:Ca-activated chloride channel family protein